MEYTLYDLFPWVQNTWVFAPAAIICLWLNDFGNGWDHWYFYSDRETAPEAESMFGRFGDYLAVHNVDVVQEAAYHLMFALVPINLVLAMGAAMVGRPLFQGQINAAEGNPVFWKGEKSYYLVMGVRIPKPFSGRKRILGVSIGAVLMAGHWFIAEWIVVAYVFVKALLGL